MSFFQRFKIYIILFLLIIIVCGGCKRKNYPNEAHIINCYHELSKYEHFQEIKTCRIGFDIDSITYFSTFKLDEKSVFNFINTTPTLQIIDSNTGELKSCLDFKQISFATFSKEMKIRTVDKYSNIYKYSNRNRFRIYSFNSQTFFNFIVIDKESDTVFLVFDLITY